MTTGPIALPVATLAEAFPGQHQPPTHALTVRLDEDLANRLYTARIATGKPSSDLIRAALRTYLATLEQGPVFGARIAELRALGVSRTPDTGEA